MAGLAIFLGETGNRLFPIRRCLKCRAPEDEDDDLSSVDGFEEDEEHRRKATGFEQEQEEEEEEDDEWHIRWPLNKAAAKKGEGDMENVDTIDSLQEDFRHIFPGSASDDEDDVSERGTVASSMWTSSSSGVFVPLFRTGDQVEAYCERRQQWLLGTLKVQTQAAPSSADVGASPCVDYSVVLDGTREVLEDLALECLRKPLSAGERAEVLTDAMYWKEATILEFKRSSQTHKVEFSGSPAKSSVTEVPSSRVRRLFGVGMEVCRYAGLREGWLDCIVVDGPAIAKPTPAEIRDVANGDDDDDEEDGTEALDWTPVAVMDVLGPAAQDGMVSESSDLSRCSRLTGSRMRFVPACLLHPRAAIRETSTSS